MYFSLPSCYYLMQIFMSTTLLDIDTASLVSSARRFYLLDKAGQARFNRPPTGVRDETLSIKYHTYIVRDDGRNSLGFAINSAIYLAIFASHSYNRRPPLLAIAPAAARSCRSTSRGYIGRRVGSLFNERRLTTGCSVNNRTSAK